MDRFRKQVLLACATIVLVIGLGAVTGLTALRRTVSSQDQAHSIDQHVLLIETLRDRVRETTASARRYMASGDHMEQQRVLALLDDIKADRVRLDARHTIAYGPVLEADLEAYQLGVLAAMSEFEPDPVQRLTRFEDQLAGVRVPLTATFDDLIAQERSQRETLRSATSLTRSAQWTLLLASFIGVMLAIGLCIAVIRRTPAQESAAASGPSARISQPLLRESFDVNELVDEVIASHRAWCAERGIKLRFVPRAGARVLADRERVRHVLGALLDSAMSETAASSEVQLHVSDNEHGVRVALIEPGTAPEPDPVALLMCRRIVDAHGGKLGVQTSSIGRTYWFTLPCEPALLR